MTLSISKSCYFPARYEFYNAKNEADETISQWAARLKILAADCAFGSELTILLRDIFLLGIGKRNILDELLNGNLYLSTMDEAVAWAYSEETKNHAELPMKNVQNKLLANLNQLDISVVSIKMETPDSIASEADSIDKIKEIYEFDDYTVTPQIDIDQFQNYKDENNINIEKIFNYQNDRVQKVIVDKAPIKIKLESEMQTNSPIRKSKRHRGRRMFMKRDKRSRNIEQDCMKPKRQKRMPDDMLTCNRPNCNFQCHALKDMNAHKTEIHFGKKEYKCDQCEYVGAQPINLRRHYVKHTGVNLYQCDVDGCTFSCKHSSSFDYHKNKYHPRGPPLECSEKGCSFSSYQPLKIKRHRILEHNKDRILTCPFCDFTCYATSDMKTHSKVHMEMARFPCRHPHCAFSAKTSSGLAKHNLQHGDKKRLACELCDFRTNFVSSLKLHQRVHTNEQPFKCEQCTRRYLTQHRLQMHTVNMHGFWHSG